MQVFIIGTPLETARTLDSKRLRKQIIECGQILDVLNGAKAWSNHPCVLQYREHKVWLQYYKRCLECYSQGFDYTPMWYSEHSFVYQPPFHTKEYYDQMKRRLYTKDKEHYKQWEHLGESQENWYYVDGSWRKYVNGKRIE
jgi:hypothetical protein